MPPPLDCDASKAERPTKRWCSLLTTQSLIIMCTEWTTRGAVDHPTNLHLQVPRLLIH